ncbi:MAG TPA: hypothetical protein VMR21_15525 [Vicinamibacteria bacterium]|nr:hypothetical protein [Vicinamibacteria bacterium]
MNKVGAILAVGALAAAAACGGGGSPSAPVAVATPTPLPVATPTPAPTPTPEPSPVAGEPAPLDSKPVRLTLRLYVVEDPSGRVFEHATASDGTPIVPVNFKFRLDVTAKDRKNKHTAGSGKPDWHFSDLNIAEIENFNNPFQPRLRATKGGEFCTTVTLDEVTSNEVCLELRY